ncbi:2829_t:CDS:2 [Acaulospora colombiana]|uniref:2829_t:CDS:1 n=1 Tax=Acaulospora colombiana TaxID=27376 RepID=A0ACA9M2L9_9GLOM|nr:2829_t:CDS:2 [Acaulospora colombiana]
MPPSNILPLINENTANEFRMEDYDLDPVTGFLPSTPPLERLPGTFYEPWEQLIDNFHDLILTGRFRSSVDKMPVLDTSCLATPAEYRRAFLVLSFLAHGYVWGSSEKISDRLPACVAIPWVKISDHLGVAPIQNHAAVVLWNWRLIFKDEPFSLNNLSTLFTFTNSLDESWFYLVTTAIEGCGGRALSSIITAINAVNVGDNNQLLRALKEIGSIIKEIIEILQRMFDKCDPYVFYWKVRPFLAGWENEDQLPLGLIYEGADNNDEFGNPIYRKYAGGSAGQSALIQALDIALNIEHHPTKFEQNSGNECTSSRINGCSFSNNALKCPLNKHVKSQLPYLHKIRQNMPGPHRRFLEDLTKVANIRNYITSKVNYGSIRAVSLLDKIEDVNNLVQAYNDCLIQMKNFRSKHLQIVSAYIVIQENRKSSHVKSILPLNEDFGANTEEIQSATKKSTTSIKMLRSIKGTGGTNLIPFLKQMRDETVAQEIMDPIE